MIKDILVKVNKKWLKVKQVLEKIMLLEKWKLIKEKENQKKIKCKFNYYKIKYLNYKKN